MIDLKLTPTLLIIIAVIIIFAIIIYKSNESFYVQPKCCPHIDMSPSVITNPFLPPFSINGCKQPVSYAHDPDIMETVPPSNQSSLVMLSTPDNRLLTT